VALERSTESADPCSGSRVAVPFSTPRVRAIDDDTIERGSLVGVEELDGLSRSSTPHRRRANVDRPWERGNGDSGVGTALAWVRA